MEKYKTKINKNNHVYKQCKHVENKCLVNPIISFVKAII